MPIETVQNKCVRCDSVFMCGASGDIACWCKRFPAVMDWDGVNDCLCPLCLGKEVDKELSNLLTQKGVAETVEFVKNLSMNSSSTIEGLDYYMKDDYCIFMKWFLLKRGYCCENGCLNCPYGDLT